MKIPVPNPQYPKCVAQVLLANGQQYTVRSGGGRFVEVEDEAVEVLLRSTSPDPDRPDFEHAWSKADGVQTMKTYLENKKLREKVAAYEERQRQQARKASSEKVSTPKRSEGPKTSDRVPSDERRDV